MKKVDIARNLFKDNSEKDNAIVAVEQFIKQLKIPITSQEIYRKLPWQHSYPSIQGVKSFLNQINVESIILEADKERLFEMPQTMLCHVNNSNGGEFRTVINHNSTQVKLLTMSNTIETFTVEDFKSSWSGVVLLAEKNETSGSKNFKTENRLAFFEESYFYLIPSFIFLSSIVVTLFNADFYYGSLLVKVIAIYFFGYLGLMLTSLLLKNSVDGDDSILNKLCFKTDKNKNCNNIITSKGSFVFGLSLSEIGFLWFATAAVYALFVPQGIYFLGLLFCFAILILPYSIFYQWKIAKQWCSTCLLVMAIILLQSIFGFSLLSKQIILNISFTDIFYFFISLGIISLFWFTMKRKAYLQLPLEIAESNYHKLKYNKKIFDLIQQNNNELLFDDNCGIELNYSNANVDDLILVISLSCNPCSNAFASLIKMIDNGLKLNAKVVISFPHDKQNSYYKTASIIYSIYKNSGVVEFIKALNYWYTNSQKDFDKFIKLYPETMIDNSFDNELENMFQWNLKNKISATPTWFVNGKELDEKYNVEDLQAIFFT